MTEEFTDVMKGMGLDVGSMLDECFSALEPECVSSQDRGVFMAERGLNAGTTMMKYGRERSFSITSVLERQGLPR